MKPNCRLGKGEIKSKYDQDRSGIVGITGPCPQPDSIIAAQQRIAATDIGAMAIGLAIKKTHRLTGLLLLQELKFLIRFFTDGGIFQFRIRCAHLGSGDAFRHAC
jgi:hypothetical protein